MFSFSFSVLQKNYGSLTRLEQKSRCKVFRIPLCQPTDKLSVVGEHREKIRKEMGRNKRKKERKKGKMYLLSQSAKLRIL